MRDPGPGGSGGAAPTLLLQHLPMTRSKGFGFGGLWDTRAPQPVTNLVSRTCDIASALSCIQQLFSIVPRCWSKRCSPLTQMADIEGTRSFVFQLLPAVFLQSWGKYIALLLFCEALKQFSTVVQYLHCSFWSLEPCKYD